MSEIEKHEGLGRDEAIAFLKRLVPSQELVGKKIPGTEVNYEDFFQLCKAAEDYVYGVNATEPGSFDEAVALDALKHQFGEHFKGMLDLEEGQV